MRLEESVVFRFSPFPTELRVLSVGETYHTVLDAAHTLDCRTVVEQKQPRGTS